MKKLTFAVIAGALLWASYWFWQARALRAEIDGWFAARQAEGWVAAAEEISVTGFPNRLDARFEGLTLAPPEGTRWEVPQLQVMRLVYQPDHLILALGGPVIATGAEAETRIDGRGMRASAVFEDGAVARIAVEAEALEIARAPGGRLALRGLTGALRREGGDRYRVALDAAPVARMEEAAGAGQVTLDATLALDGALAPGARLREIDLAALDYRRGRARLGAEAELEVDRRGRLSGPLTLTGEDWQALLDAAAAEGHLPRPLLPLLENALSAVAVLGGDPDRLDVALRLDRGAVSLGPLMLGTLPRLPQP